MNNRRKTGERYEEKAADFLRENGYQIIEKNYRCRLGEIDLIARDERDPVRPLVFIEVKYRSSLRYGDPVEAVDLVKQKKIIRVSQYYRVGHQVPPSEAIRFDVVGILPDRICLIKNAFEGN